MPKVVASGLLAIALFSVTFAVNLSAPLYSAYAEEKAAWALPP